MRNKEQIREIFNRFKHKNANPTTELVYHSPYELLISVILSAQATDISVNKATRILFPIANTPEKIVNLTIDTLKNYIKSIGLYNTKALNIIKTSQLLLDKYDGNVPSDRAALESLPGVGRKTANVILNTYFGQHVIAVDTHIFRVAKRIGLAKGNTPLAVEQQLMAVIPKEFLLHAHHWLILHGRYTCTARNPHCKECLINDLCEYYTKSRSFE